MIPWAAQRKLRLLFVILGVFVLAVLVQIVIGYFALHRPPSCNDGIKNQAEVGIDCGGPCANLCKSQALDPVVFWQKYLPVVPGVYNVAAYIQNPNLDAEADSVPYTFKLYDKNDILIADRSGQTVIPAKTTFPIFEGAVSTGSAIPSRITFSFDSPVVWSPVKTTEPTIKITDQALDTITGIPHISATLTNSTFTPIHGFDVLVVVYDSQGTAQAVSKTVVDLLDQNSTAVVNFSWPKAFSFAPAKIDIIPKIYPGLNY